MFTVTSTHVPFALLPFEARVLFNIQSLSAFEYHCGWSHTSAEIYTDLEKVWNSEQLTEDDLKDWVRMSGLLDAQLLKCSS